MSFDTPWPPFHRLFALEVLQRFATLWCRRLRILRVVHLWVDQDTVQWGNFRKNVAEFYESSGLLTPITAWFLHAFVLCVGTLNRLRNLSRCPRIGGTVILQRVVGRCQLRGLRERDRDLAVYCPIRLGWVNHQFEWRLQCYLSERLLTFRLKTHWVKSCTRVFCFTRDF